MLGVDGSPQVGCVRACAYRMVAVGGYLEGGVIPRTYRGFGSQVVGHSGLRPCWANEE